MYASSAQPTSTVDTSTSGMIAISIICAIALILIAIAVCMCCKPFNEKELETIQQEQQDETKDGTETVRKSKLPTIIITIIITIVVIIGCANLIDCATQNNGKLPTNTAGQTQLLSRSARKNDISIVGVDISMYPLGELITIKPTTNIKNLTLKMVITENSTGNVLSSKEIRLGDVEKDIEYQFTYDISDMNLSLTNMLKYLENNISVDLNVTNGTVSYFQ
jgi:hypothetical protein